ncbi:hypothetical protein Cgig2_002234 [Carnegiea gigantea]|uniref:Uncharacterized protein n=1 Tax=Carnegiea gigantea TaxID=171969 RepID=A0A9Q1KU40_9CARY|nr:hypothetical protein Cgig2_002234 [Carnegiea gigantea]
MEAYEASRAVFSRVQSVDPENASKIMGYILLHHGEKDMIRFAYGPETLIVSIVNRAKTDLGLLSNASSAPVVSPISNPIAISRPNPLSLSLPPPRLPTNGFNLSSPSSPSVWSHHRPLSPNAAHSLSYAAVVNGTCNSNGSLSSPSIGSPQIGFSSNSNNRESFMDEYRLQDQNLQYLSDPSSKNVEFFDQNMDLAMSPSCRSDSVLYPYEGNPHFHRRSASFNDMYYGTDDSTSGFGFKPCLYYARGFCKNGSTCKFVHGCGFSDSPENPAIVGSPCKYDVFDQCQEEILRSKFARQQRLAAQLMAYNKLNFLPTEAQRSAAAALMMGDDFHKLNRVRMARNDFSVMGMRGDSNPGSRQIYLTFPADSTFKEEDVSEYFSRFGPVQDVRIPYQQKRMFGFVTFVYPETVNMILAKGNPHFVCDSRVLVKPYKEKGKLPDKKQPQQQQLDRVEFSSSSPCGLDCREPYELQLGGRMFYSTQEMLLKKLEEQADLQQTLEAQGRRLMNLQLLDMKNHQQQQHSMSVRSPILSPHLSQASSTQNTLSPPNGGSQDFSEGKSICAFVGSMTNLCISNLFRELMWPSYVSNNAENKGSPTEASEQELHKVADTTVFDGNGNAENKEDNPNHEESRLPESFEHILPDNLFASPTKSAAELQSSVFSPPLVEVDGGGANHGSSCTAKGDSSPMPSATSLNIPPHKSCFFEMPRLSPGHGALGM